MAQAQSAETAIYVIRRNAGENNDRKAEKGDYYLTDTEEDNLRKLTGCFSHTVVVLNTCVIDTTFLETIPGIDALVLMGLAGSEAGNALADVLSGEVNPSGHLTDTWAMRYSDYPAASTFGMNDGDALQEDYNEDVFVGYRYFDSFEVTPRFPFGFGLSYTSFRRDCLRVEADWQTIRVYIRVCNTGDTAGRDVPQLYVSAPFGRLSKPRQELKAYAKTSLLLPGEAEEIVLELDTESLASFDEEQAAFVMEQGDYLLRLGSHSRETEIVAALRLDGEAVLRRVRNEFFPDRMLSRLVPPTRIGEKCEAPVIPLHAGDCRTKDGACRDREEEREDLKAMSAAPVDMSATLIDVKDGRVSMESFVRSLDDDTLLRLVKGTAGETPWKVEKRGVGKRRKVKGPMSSGSTTALFLNSLAIPNWLVTDGPAGLHLPGCGATGYPAGTVIAQTWNDEAARLVGRGIGKELRYYHYSVILGPGMNIHRDPLCGRNFEYYAEDPLLSGRMGAGTTLGVQETPGTGVSIKHFCCNNQEAERLDTNATVSERALREIYLKGFEICVRTAKPRTVMTSYNKVNGIHTSSNYKLIHEVLRGEWGFDGLVMTDWSTHSNKVSDLHAGNDLIMGGYRTQALLSAMHGLPPEFDKDGYVLEKDYKVFGGFFTEHAEFWNAFTPTAEGLDEVCTDVAAGIKLNPKAGDCLAQGVAVKENLPDGGVRLRYRGKNTGVTLRREDAEACACRVLREIMHSVSFEIMMGGKR